jgi:hypothetical protein
MVIKIAVVTGGHSYEVEPFHKLFHSMAGIEAYLQHLDDFTSSSESVRDSYAAVVFYIMPIEDPRDDNMPWYCGKPKTALEHLGSTPQGIVLLHHGIVAYPGWPVWDEIAGVSGRVNTSYHFDQHVPVEIAAPQHPILTGLSSWTITDETYVIPNFHPDGEILLTTDYSPSWPVLAWARTYRKAHVFCYQSGHDGKTYADPSFRSLLANGIRWTSLSI